MRIAAYARYSSDSQREASIEDQLRACRKRSAVEGWPAPEIYSDSAISGARTDRVDYLRLLRDAHQFDVIMVDDLTRFGRDKDEIGKTVKRLTFAGVRLIGCSDGIDTARKSHKVDVGMRGLMGEIYLDDLAEKTHRGLTGRALAGASAGGLAYGYRVTETGSRAIDEAQATVVRRIFAAYLAGTTPRQIANALNEDRIPSARGSTWAMSAIRGDKRGIGILSNALYVGRQIWNRSRWVKHPDTGRRLRKERPESEWIVTEHPELAIVDPATWSAAQRRLSARRQPMESVRTPGTGRGRPPRYLLSGLLRCESCGGPIVVIDRRRYGCNVHKDRGPAACPNNHGVNRVRLETALLSNIRETLLGDAAFARMQRQVADTLRSAAPDTGAARRRLAEAEILHGNIMNALRAGIITPSTRAELLAAEHTVAEAKRELEDQKAFQPSQILPRYKERWRKMVEGLAEHGRSLETAREAIRELLGDGLVLRNQNGETSVEIPPSQINVVAGAGFALCLHDGFEIPISSGEG